MVNNRWAEKVNGVHFLHLRRTETLLKKKTLLLEALGP